MNTNEYYRKPNLYGIGTEDIAQMIANKTDKGIYEELEACLYHIRACAQNELNNDFWRVFWNALVVIAEQEDE